MAELSSWASQNSGPTGTIDVQEARVHLGAFVTAASSNVAKSGFRPQSSYVGQAQVTATGTPDGFVHVAPFQLFLQSGRASVPGVYVACLDAIKDINILSTPADPTNPRDDLIVAQQSDTFYGDANSDFVVRHVVGTPAGSPSDPAVSGSTDYVALARVRVNAGATTITQGNITQLHTSGHAKSLSGGMHAVALGGILPVETKAQRDALLGNYPGFAVWRRDLGNMNVFNVAGDWRYIARPTGATVATSQTSASTTYADLATVGPQVALDTGTAVMVHIKCGYFNSSAVETFMSFAVSGASTVAAADTAAISIQTTSLHRQGASFLVTGLTAGTNTFTAKYRVASGTGTFRDRDLIVEPK